MHDRPDAGGASAATAPTAQPAAGTRVSIQNVRRQFPNGVLALDDITLDVPPGQFISILGPSGSGKSTLLRLIAGLDTPQGGTIAVHPGAPGPNPPLPPGGEGRGEGSFSSPSPSGRGPG